MDRKLTGAAMMIVGILTFPGEIMAQEIDPAELVKDIHAIFGDHHARAVHTKGVIFEGSFEPTADAATLSKAAIFAGKVSAIIRLSNTTGIPTIPDNDPNATPHGLAVKFTLADGSDMDLVTHSYNGFPVPNAVEFDKFLKAVVASGPTAAKPTPIEQYLGSHPAALAFVTQQKPPPESLATTAYFGVNAFTFTDAAGKATMVRYRMVPQAGEKYLSADAAKAKGPNYLMEEIAARVGQAPVAFDWLAQIAQDGDKLDDPSTPWPEDRKLVKLGTLTISKLAEDQDGQTKSLLFVPSNVPDGIAPADPMIDIRAGAYAVSFGERQ
jgi:catalase